MKARILFAALLGYACSTTALAAAENDPRPCQPTSRADWNCRPHDVSLIRLIADPAGFDGKRVRTVGLLDLDGDVTMVYLHREDQQMHLLRNGLALRSPPGKDCRSGSYVILDGVFAAPDYAKRTPSTSQHACLTCGPDPTEKFWLHPAGGTLDVLRCMPKK